MLADNISKLKFFPQEIQNRCSRTTVKLQEVQVLLRYFSSFFFKFMLLSYSPETRGRVNLFVKYGLHDDKYKYCTYLRLYTSSVYCTVVYIDGPFDRASSFQNTLLVFHFLSR